MPSMRSTTIYEAPRPAARPGETVITSTCGHNCGGRCVVNAHVRDGRIVHISTDARRWNPDHPPLARLRPRRRPDRAHLSSRPAAISACAAPARAAPASSSASPGTRRSTRSRARCCGCARTLWQRRDPRCLALRQQVHAARPRRGAALPLHVRRLHRAMVEHVGRGRGIRRAHDLWRQGRLQDLRPRADRLRQLQADPDVGLESRRRHLRHRHDAVSESRRSSRARASSASIRGARSPAASWPTSTSSSALPPTPRR